LEGLGNQSDQDTETSSHKGAGGVSLAAIHIAKHMFGCKVIATCGSEAKRQVCLQQGADYAIDYTVTKDWAAEVKRITEKDLGRKGQRIGVDLVYDPIAGGCFLGSLKRPSLTQLDAVSGQRLPEGGCLGMQNRGHRIRLSGCCNGSGKGSDEQDSHQAVLRFGLPCR
jgi:hypothetical protein